MMMMTKGGRIIPFLLAPRNNPTFFSEPMETPLVVHLDGFFDNPSGDFTIEQTAVEAAGGRFLAPPEGDPEAALEAAATAKVALVRAAGLDRRGLRKLKACQTIIRYGIGLDKIDLEAAREQGVAVCNVPDFCLEEMADHTLTLALAVLRKIQPYAIEARSGDWRLTRQLPLQPFSSQRFVTLGFGRIARAVHQRAAAFGFRQAAYDPHLPLEVFEEAGVESVDLEEAFQTADLLSLHCPMMEETRNLVNAHRFASMKSSACLVNTARGGLVDTEALVEALRSGMLGGAGLDVTEPEPLPAGHPLYDQPTAIITPHVGWYSEEAENRLKQLAAEEAARALRGEPLRCRVV